MILKKAIKGMLPDIKSVDMPESGAYLLHNLRYKNGRLYPVDGVFKHIILKAEDMTEGAADSETAPLGGKKPIYAFYANGKLIVITSSSQVYIANVEGSIREGSYAPFENTGGAAAAFQHIAYSAVDNDGDPLPQNLLECTFIPTKNLVGKTLYVNGAGYLCTGVYSVGDEAGTKWLIKLDNFIPVAGTTYTVYRKKVVASPYTASEYTFAETYSMFGAVHRNADYTEFDALAFNKTRKVNGVQKMIGFKSGVPITGTAYVTALSTKNEICSNSGKAWPIYHYIMMPALTETNSTIYVYKDEGSRGEWFYWPVFLALGFNKKGLTSFSSNSEVKWRAKPVPMCLMRDRGGTWYGAYGLPFQGDAEDETIITINVGALGGVCPNNNGHLTGIYLPTSQTTLNPTGSCTVIPCGAGPDGDGKWYTAANGEIDVDVMDIENRLLKPTGTTISETDDDYPQWGVIKSDSPIQTIAAGTALFSGKLGTAKAAGTISVLSAPTFINTADHAIVVNPKTFSQAIVFATLNGLMSFTPGEASYAKLGGIGGAKYCAYFNNMLVIANTMEVDYVEEEGTAHELSVVSYNKSTADDTEAEKYGGYEILFAHPLPSWVVAGAMVWFKGYGLPTEIEKVMCKIHSVRTYAPTGQTATSGVRVKGATGSVPISVDGYEPSQVVMKPSVRAEKPSEQTVRNSTIYSYMDFAESNGSEATSSKAYKLFGSFTPITGLAVLNGILYVFKRDTITEGTYTGNVNMPISMNEDKFKFGGYNATTIDDKIFYYHPAKGICVFDGMRESIISEGMNSIFKTGEWFFVKYSDSAIAVVPTTGGNCYLWDGGAWSRLDGGEIVPVFNSPELEYIETTDDGVYLCSIPQIIKNTGFNWRVNQYFSGGGANATFDPKPLAFSAGSYGDGNVAVEAPEYIISTPLETEKKDLAKRVRAITVDGLAGGVDGARIVTCRVESTHDGASNEPAATDQAVNDPAYDGKSECKVYPNVVGRDPFAVLRASREVPAVVSTNVEDYSNWVDETSVSALNIDIESSGENPRR